MKQNSMLLASFFVIAFAVYFGLGYVMKKSAIYRSIITIIAGIAVANATELYMRRIDSGDIYNSRQIFRKD